MTDAASEAGTGQPAGIQNGASRPVGAALAIGIVFVPFVFTWFLLREGYGVLARVLGFGWLAVFVLLGMVTGPAPEEGAGVADTSDASRTAQAEPVTPAPEIAAAAVQADGTGRGLRGVLSDPGCTRTDQTPGWKAIEINAILTADRYAVANNPKAAFADAKGKISWQPDEEHPEDINKGSYSLILINDQVALAELVPLFDLCTPASQLDPEGELWEVVLAKLNGKFF